MSHCFYQDGTFNRESVTMRSLAAGSVPSSSQGSRSIVKLDVIIDLLSSLGLPEFLRLEQNFHG